MSPFEQQVAEALEKLRCDWVAAGYSKAGDLSEFLAPRVAAAIEAAAASEFPGTGKLAAYAHGRNVGLAALRGDT